MSLFACNREHERERVRYIRIDTIVDRYIETQCVLRECWCGHAVERQKRKKKKSKKKRNKQAQAFPVCLHSSKEDR